MERRVKSHLKKLERKRVNMQMLIILGYVIIATLAVFGTIDILKQVRKK